MPASDRLKRLLLDTIANNVNEMTLGFDGTPATSSDGSAGRPAVTIKPTVTILDDTSLLIEGNLGTDHHFADSITEVYIQFKNSDSEFTPIARHVIKPVLKTVGNEMRVQVLMEVR